MSSLKPILLFSILSLLPPTHAKDFTKWYPHFNHFEKPQWTACVAQQTNLLSDSSCREITNCILDSLTEDFKAMLGSISVFLGFTPTLVLLMGPSIMDISLLSLKRPLLSSLCALGTPGFFFDRPFQLLDSESSFHKILHSGTNMKVEQDYFSHVFSSPFICRLLSAVQYMLAAAATANTIHNSWEIGNRAVITFSCHQSGRLPLGWFSFSAGINLLGIIFTHSTLKSVARTDLVVDRDLVSQSVARQSPFKNWLHAEPKLCCQQEGREYRPRTGNWVACSMLLRWSFDVLIVAQFAMGTLVMSSVIFVRIEDAAAVVVRYLVSALMVRCIVAFEIEGLKYAQGRGGRGEYPVELLQVTTQASRSELLQK